MSYDDDLDMSAGPNWDAYYEYMEYMDQLDAEDGKSAQHGKIATTIPKQKVTGDDGKSFLVDTKFAPDIVSFSVKDSSDVDNAARPILPAPTENPGAYAPYDTYTSQRLINEYFGNQVIEGLKAHHNITGKEVQGIYNFIVSGTPILKDPLLLKIATEVQATATQKTQQTWQIPTWKVNTHDAVNFVPTGHVDATEVSPLTIGKAFSHDHLTSFLSQGHETVDLAEKLLQEALNMSPGSAEDNQNAATYRSYLVLVANVLAKLKQLLIQTEIDDSQNTQKWQQGKMDTAGEMKDLVDEIMTSYNSMLAKNAQIRAEQAAAQNWQLAVDILGPVLTFLAGAVTVATCGASGAVLAIVIAFQTVSVAYSVTDSVLSATTGTGLTSRIVDSFNKAIEADMQGQPQWAIDLMKAVIVITVVMVLIVAAIATGGGTIAETASMVLKQAVKQAIRLSISEMLMQAALMALMSSGAVADMVIAFMEIKGPLSPEQENNVKKWVAIVEAVATVGIMLVMGAKAIKKEVTDMANAVQDAAATRTITQKVVALLKRLINYIKESLVSLLNVKALAQDLYTYFTKVNDWVGVLERAVLVIEMVGKVVPQIGMANAYFELAAMKKAMANMTRELALPQAEVQFLQSMINIIDGILSQITDGMNTTSKELTDISDEVNQMFSSSSQSISKLLRANSPMAG